MSTWKIAILVYVVVALVAYLHYNLTAHISRYRKPPRPFFRWATPWGYTPYGNWLFGSWRKKRGFPEWGIRVLGFEYWVEYWRERR